MADPVEEADGVDLGVAVPIGVSMNAEPAPVAVVFRGSKALCREFSLVLEARGIEHDVQQTGVADPAGSWIVTVAPNSLHAAYDEITRYGAERGVPPNTPVAAQPFPGAALGAAGYAVVLLLTAYCAGIGLFGVDWLSAGALDAGAAREWWRAVTALTLHLDQEHLLGNLLFGTIAGLAAGRLLGPGVAWASILGAAAAANYAEALIAPVAHRAVGASTAVFAALGLLTGLAWRQQLTRSLRLWYRWSPLVAGISLLTLLGAGDAHVDVLGHALGFLCGVGVGWLHARAGTPRNRGRHLQIATGAAAALLICAAWFFALRA
jgi:membrane associated rhomboid family serine protease